MNRRRISYEQTIETSPNSASHTYYSHFVIFPRAGSRGGSGPGYVNEDFIVAEDKDFAVAPWVISYDQFFFDETFQLFHNQNGYVQIDDSSNWLIRTRQGIRFPIYKGFSTTFRYDYDYDNQPSEDTEEKWDSKLMFLLGYELKN